MTLAVHYIGSVITMSISEMIPLKRTVISNVILPEFFAGQLVQPDDVDEQLEELKYKCI